MKAAGLEAIDTVIDSTAILIQNFHSSDQQMIDLIISRLRGIIGMSDDFNNNFHFFFSSSNWK